MNNPSWNHLCLESFGIYSAIIVVWVFRDWLLGWLRLLFNILITNFCPALINGVSTSSTSLVRTDRMISWCFGIRWLVISLILFGFGPFLVLLCKVWLIYFIVASISVVTANWINNVTIRQFVLCEKRLMNDGILFSYWPYHCKSQECVRTVRPNSKKTIPYVIYILLTCSLKEPPAILHSINSAIITCLLPFFFSYFVWSLW